MSEQQLYREARDVAGVLNDPNSDPAALRSARAAALRIGYSGVAAAGADTLQELVDRNIGLDDWFGAQQVLRDPDLQ